MSDHLCENLIFEIFTRLPPKSLLRFRSLSKSLRSLISSPGFIRMHTLRSPQKLLIRQRKLDWEEDFRILHSEDFCSLHSEDQLPLCPRRGYFGITPVKFPHNRHPVDIVGSCNGILCLYDKYNICLWNPSIRRKLTLPECTRRCTFWVAFGFGFDPISDDYKVVSVYDSEYGENAKSSFVYTLKTGTWCEIASPSPFQWKELKSKACCVNGTLHWVVRSWLPIRDNAADFSIMTFNLSNHVFGMIALPRPTGKSIHLTIIQGSLAVVSMELGNCLIWVRKDASWSVYLESKKIQVEGKIINVLQPSSNGDLLIHTLIEGFQVFNRKLGYVPIKLVGFNAADIYLDMVEMELCSESLGLLDMGTACKENLLSFLEEKREAFSG